MWQKFKRGQIALRNSSKETGANIVIRTKASSMCHNTCKEFSKPEILMQKLHHKWNTEFRHDRYNISKFQHLEFLKPPNMNCGNLGPIKIHHVSIFCVFVWICMENCARENDFDFFLNVLINN